MINWKTGRQSTKTAELDNGEATSYTITGLRNSSVYSVSLRAKNAAGAGDSASVPSGSNNFSVTPVPTAPTTPQDLTVTPGNQTLTLIWEEPADDGGTTFNAVGAGPNPTGEIQATTGLFPDAPTSVTAVPTPNGNGSTLTVTWNRVTRTNGAGPVSSYIVETLDLTNPGNTWVLTTGIDGTTTTAVVHVVIGRTYLVRVKAVALHTGNSKRSCSATAERVDAPYHQTCGRTNIKQN